MDGIRVLTFDCDGVLFDTEQANKAFYNKILTHFDRPPMSAEQFAHAQMHTADQALAALFPDAGEYTKAQQYRKEIGYSPFIAYMQMDPDLVSVLEKYYRQVGLAVATNRTDTMDRVLDVHRIAAYFDLVVTALDVDRPKPHPDCLNRVLEHFRALPAEMLYVGDSSLDARAAEAAGVWFAACRNPEIPGDFYIDRLSELVSIISAAADGSAL
ncbi:MAG: HAD-IA family hydrolase [Desulfosalsimonadaceae bacterium]